MAKKGKKKKHTGRTFKKGGSKLTKAEIKAAGGDLKKAWAIHRAKHGGGATKTKTTRKAAKRSGGKRRKKGQTAKQRAASKRNIKKAQAELRKKRGGRKSPKRSKSKLPRRAGRRSAGRAGTRTVKTTIIKTGRNTREVAIVKVPVEHRARKRKGGKRHRKGGGGRRRGGRYMAENPLGGGEILLGGFTGLLGFMVGDGVDRFLATHALTDKNSKDANGNELYTDNPPTTGSYSGLYNATAILAPMGLLRWGVGLGVPFVFVLGGRMIRNPLGRSGVQMFGFVWGVRTLGKGLTDLVAYMTKTMAFGQRLYDGEMRATSMQAGTNGYPLSSLPSTGLGRALKKPCGVGNKPCCDNCANGLPCSGEQKPPAPPAPPGYAGIPTTNGALPGMQPQPTTHTVPAPAAATVPAPSNGAMSYGLYAPRFSRANAR